MKDAPSPKDGTTDASTTNNNSGFQRGWFTDLRLAEQAPDQLADFAAIAAHHPDIDITVAQGLRHGAADITTFEQDDVESGPVIDYDLPAKQLDNNRFAIRLGQLVNKRGSVYVTGPMHAIRQSVKTSLEADASDVVNYELSSGPMGLSRQAKIINNVAEYHDFPIGTWSPSTTFDKLDIDRALEQAASAVEYGDGYIVVVERVRDDLVAGWAIKNADEATAIEAVSSVVQSAKAVAEVSSSAIRLETMGDV